MSWHFFHCWHSFEKKVEYTHGPLFKGKDIENETWLYCCYCGKETRPYCDY